MSRAPSPARRPGWQWTEYWRDGRSEVMTLDDRGGQTAFDAAAVWRPFFATFDEGARLIDLATGGGQVAGHAKAISESRGKAFEIVGVDLADLDAGVAGQGQGVTLVGSVMLEKLPFPAEHFDGASSQFGIEYSDHRPALAELSRVLRPGGRALMLIHHAGSAITRSTAAQTAAYDRVLGDGAAIRQARRAFTAHLKGLPTPATGAAEHAFRDAVKRAAARLEPSPAFESARYLVGYLADLAERTSAYAPDSALARLDAFEFGNASWRQRHRSQLAAAMDPAALDTFLQRADRVGLAGDEPVELRDGRGDLIAWRVALSKR